MADDDLTQMIQRVAAGDRAAASELLPLLYDDLRRLAAARMAALRPGHTLQPTALVHEAYLDLIGKADPGWNGRAHFFGAAAQAMREILVDHARRRGALKRGGDKKRVHESLGGMPGEVGLSPEELLGLEDALTALEAEYPRQARVVVMRFFGGLTHEEIAALLEATTRTVERDWRFARAWLRARLGEAS